MPSPAEVTSTLYLNCESQCDDKMSQKRPNDSKMVAWGRKMLQFLIIDPIRQYDEARMWDLYFPPFAVEFGELSDASRKPTTPLG